MNIYGKYHGIHQGNLKFISETDKHKKKKTAVLKPLQIILYLKSRTIIALTLPTKFPNLLPLEIVLNGSELIMKKNPMKMAS